MLDLLLETLGRLSDRGDSPITILLLLLLEFHKLFLGILKLFEHGAEGFHDFFVYFEHVVLADVSGVGAIDIAYLNLRMYRLDPFNDLLQVVSFQVFKMRLEFLDDMLHGIRHLVGAQSQKLFTQNKFVLNHWIRRIPYRFLVTNLLDCATLNSSRLFEDRY